LKVNDLGPGQYEIRDTIPDVPKFLYPPLKNRKIKPSEKG